MFHNRLFQVLSILFAALLFAGVAVAQQYPCYGQAYCYGQPTSTTTSSPPQSPPWSGLSDGRVNPDPAEYYSIWCKNGFVEIWRGVPSGSMLTLFFAAGAIYTAAHKTEVSQLAGIGRRMPWTMVAFGIGVLSMIGLPPTGGFVSKWFMLSGAMQVEHWTAVAVIAVSTLLSFCR